MITYQFVYTVVWPIHLTVEYDVKRGRILAVRNSVSLVPITSPNVFLAAQQHYDSLTVQERYGIQMEDECGHSERVQDEPY